MKNNILRIFLLILIFQISFNANSAEQFNFDVKEITILENGNKFVGKNRGVITTDSGIIINADTFEYYKKSNILIANGNVKIVDTINNNEIYTENITYEKNKSLIYTKNNSKALDLDEGIEINADNFEYDLNKNLINAKENVVARNILKNYTISADVMSYLLDENKIYTIGETFANFSSKYNFQSSNVTLLTDKKELFSNKKTTITDKSNLYKLEKFRYFIEKEELKGEKILINTDYNLPTSDKIYFLNAIINLKKQSFFGSDVKIKIRKDIFEDTNNDPRILGVSASSNINKTKINKAVFTSCQQNEKCVPWSIKAKEIIHDKENKEIVYNNALLKIYNFPVLYFPKFFHPDPTVKRRSGFLQPQFNNSNLLGNSFSIPYFSVLADNRDFTFTPYIFENNLQMFQNEIREVNKHSKIYANFGFVNNYKSTLDSKKNSIFNLFANYELDLNFKNFSKSNLFLSIEKITNDTFLKVFDTHLQDDLMKPSDNNNLKNELKFSLNHNEYDLEIGAKSFENLQKKNSDRYEYILPYYNYSTILNDNFFNGSLSFNSYSDNILNNTNQLKSNLTNDLGYIGREYISFNALENTMSINIKNLNSVGKNTSEYKSSPQVEFMGEINLNSKYPLIKQNKDSINYLTPKILLKLNPSDMKDYATSDRTINVDNIFNINRLGISDTLETGKSLTLGIDYKKEKFDNYNKFFEFKLATVLRDKEENFIPKKTSLNKKNSNIFGSVNNNFSDFFNLNYKFALDNNFNAVEHSDLGAEFKLNNFNTKFNFLEESGEMGSSNFLENETNFQFDEQNFITFKTRRNRKLNLTEYYDLVYEYKNDCLSAGIKYKKTYYEDRELKPSENLFFTISLIPLTNYEQKIER